MEIGLAQIQLITCISKKKTKIKQYSLSTTVDNQKRSYVGPLPKPNLFLHELISQIPLLLKL